MLSSGRLPPQALPRHPHVSSTTAQHTSRVSATLEPASLISFPSLPGTWRDRHTSGPCYNPEIHASNCPQSVSSPLTKEPPCRAPAASCDHGPVVTASLSISLSTPHRALLETSFPSFFWIPDVSDLPSGSSCARAGRYERKPS